MTSKARQLLTGLAAVAIILIVGGVLFDRHETRAYAECVDESRVIVGGSYNAPPDPGTEWVEFVLSGCEDANRVGLTVSGIGAVLLGIAVIVWWARRRAAGPEWE